MPRMARSDAAFVDDSVNVPARSPVPNAKPSLTGVKGTMAGKPAPSAGFAINDVLNGPSGVAAIPGVTRFQMRELGKGLSGWSGIVPYYPTAPKVFS